jgi:hypothetical protein
MKSELKDIEKKYLGKLICLIDYFTDLHLFSAQERKLLGYVKEGNYKKIVVLFKSKRNEPLEIAKSKTTQVDILNIIRENEYREFILIDKKGKEFRIREERQEDVIKQFIVEDVLESDYLVGKPSKKKVKVIKLKD